MPDHMDAAPPGVLALNVEVEAAFPTTKLPTKPDLADSLNGLRLKMVKLGVDVEPLVSMRVDEMIDQLRRPRS